MTADDLISLTREYLGDTVAPYLWSDGFLLGALNRAEQEAAVRTLCLPDATTTAICRIALVAGTARYAHDPRIIRIESIYLDGALLEHVDAADMDARFGAAWATEANTPMHWFSDGRTLTVHPTPVLPGALELVVYRWPMVDMTLNASPKVAPEIDVKWHRALAHWVCFEAYQMVDTDNQRGDRAMPHLAQFEQVFGPAVSARVQRHQRCSPRLLSLTAAPYVRPHHRGRGDWP